MQKEIKRVLLAVAQSCSRHIVHIVCVGCYQVKFKLSVKPLYNDCIHYFHNHFSSDGGRREMFRLEEQEDQ